MNRQQKLAAEVFGIKPARGGFVILAPGCDKWELYGIDGKGYVFPDFEAAKAVALVTLRAQKPNPFKVGDRVTLTHRVGSGKKTETLHGGINYFSPRSSTWDLGHDPVRNFGHNGDCECTFQLATGGLLGGWYHYSDLKPDKSGKPFTWQPTEEKFQRLAIEFGL